MNDSSIKNAWEYYVADLPIKPHDVPVIVQQVLYELATAASSNPYPPVDEATSTARFPNGLAITLKEPQDQPDGHSVTEFAVSITNDETTKRKDFFAMASAKGNPPRVSHPHNPSDFVEWNKDQGPQKAWMVTNLRAQIVDFISNTQRSLENQ